jgi:uncharacterized protein
VGDGFLNIAMTASVRAAQTAHGSAGIYGKLAGRREFSGLTAQEVQFIALRDSFYMATLSETGWPYIQHSGGPAGFLRALDGRTLACADFRGNRQYISIGNLAVHDRACLFLMDYPHRARLKMYVHVEIRGVEDAEIMAAVNLAAYKAKVERALVFHVEGFDWNCPQHITPRFTEYEVASALAPIKTRLEQLETENASLRSELKQVRGDAESGQPSGAGDAAVNARGYR